MSRVVLPAVTHSVIFQTYKTHLEGKAHKKKAAGPSPTPTNVTTYRCDLCDVVCTSKDAIEAHFRGAKHQKVCAYCIGMCCIQIGTLGSQVAPKTG